MAKKYPSDSFVPNSYHISKTDEGIRLIINGRRIGRPTHRLTLRQTGLKIMSAVIESTTKNKTIDFQITRINHLPTRNEVRLHTAQPQYPGSYKVEIEYTGASYEDLKEKLTLGGSIDELSDLMPSFDEPAEQQPPKIEIL